MLPGRQSGLSAAGALDLLQVSHAADWCWEAGRRRWAGSHKRMAREPCVVHINWLYLMQLALALLSCA